MPIMPRKVLRPVGQPISGVYNTAISIKNYAMNNAKNAVILATNVVFKYFTGLNNISF